MNSVRLEKGLFNLTAAIVFAVFIILIFNLLSFRPSPRKSLNSSRTPASVIGESAALGALTVAPPEERKLPCLNDGSTFHLSSPSRRLRLAGKVCAKNAEVTESLIVNKTNGFVATVFSLPNREFTTDLIDLNPGENHIHISHRLAGGQRVMSEVLIKF
jgi:hypothetical protein